MAVQAAKIQLSLTELLNSFVLFGKRKNKSVLLLQSKMTLLQQVRCLKDL